MGGTPRGNDKPRSSHKDGKFRDPAIEQLQDEEFIREDLDRLIKRGIDRERRL